MSKFNELVNKIEVFEKVAVYGDRGSFLQSLAVSYEPVDNDDLANTINAVRTAVQNWISNSADVQADLPVSGIKGLPPALRDPYQVVRSTNTFNVDTLPVLYKALLDLSTARNFGNMGGNAQSDWMKNVFPILGTAMQKVKKQMDYLKAYQLKFQELQPNNAPVEQAKYDRPVTAPQSSPVKSKSMSEQASSLAKMLTNKISNLPASKNRANDLKNINENVKSLQRYFKALQGGKDMPGYFARMEIVKALQNAYTELNYDDLDVVSALNSGRGVPENPDSKI